MAARNRRVLKEYTDWLKEPIEGVYLKPKPDDILLWSGAFEGPKDTPYAGGVYLLEIKFPPEYPFKPYNITLTTKIHHINFDDKGKAWLMDPNQWSPALMAKRSIALLMELIAKPDVDLAMSQRTYDEWMDNRAAFDEKAREMRDMYATGDIRDWYCLHQDPDWAKPYTTPQPAASNPSQSTSTPIFGSPSQPVAASSTFQSTSTPTFGFQPQQTASSLQFTGFAAPNPFGTTDAPKQPSFAFGITPAPTAAPPPDEAALKQLLETKQRLRLEYEDLVAHPIPCVVAAPDPEDPLHWTGVIDELYGTPYENDLIKFDITFSPKSNWPVIKIKTPIKHPLITTDTTISPNLLSEFCKDVSDLLRGLVTLMKKK